MGRNKNENKMWDKVYTELKKVLSDDTMPIEEDFEKWFNDINNSLNSKWYRIQKESKDDAKKYTVGWGDSFKFKVWYSKTYYEQRRLCKYCDIPQEYLLSIYGRDEGFRKGRRGKTLEIDRPNNEGYDENCVLACYPCNNAKSDVFNNDEFKKIEESIKEVWVEKVAKLRGAVQTKKKKVLEFIKNNSKLKNDKTVKKFLKF